MPARLRFARPHQVRQASAGFTLIESILVIVVLGIISAYAIPSGFNDSRMTLDAQGKTMASHLQRAQLLATTTGQRVYFCAASTGYRILVNDNCTTSTAPVVDVTFDKQVTLPSSPASLSFDSLGQPSAAVSFVLSSAPAGSGAITVSTASVTGLVSISP